MKPISADSGRIYTFIEPDGGMDWASGSLPLSTTSGHIVRSYRELLEKCASIKFYNRQYDILFRGQSKDHMAGVHSNLYSSIYRNLSASVTGDSRSENRKKLLDRYIQLERMEELLITSLQSREVYHDRIVRWSILQHYGICPTPLLDVTGSLQVGLSFALEKQSQTAILYLFGLPHLTGPVSVSVISGTQSVQLTQLCPPSALRPHFQEAVLLGTYPAADRAAIEGRGSFFDPNLSHNFACRLIAKFQLTGTTTWNAEGFHPIDRTIMYPDLHDEIFKATAHLRNSSVP